MGGLITRTAPATAISNAAKKAKATLLMLTTWLIALTLEAKYGQCRRATPPALKSQDGSTPDASRPAMNSAPGVIHHIASQNAAGCHLESRLLRRDVLGNTDSCGRAPKTRHHGCPFPEEKERAVNEVFKIVSPWSSMKRSGRAALPAGEAIRHFDALIESCSDHRLWIVPVGEIEGFCRSVGSHGPRFVEKVLEERSLETDPELQEAREFIGKIWAKAKPSSETESATASG